MRKKAGSEMANFSFVTGLLKTLATIVSNPIPDVVNM